VLGARVQEGYQMATSLPASGSGSSERDHPRAALDSGAVVAAYARWAGVYDAVFGGVSAFGRRRAVEAVNQLPGTEVLEVGVGTGLALPHYRREKRVTGIDLSAEMLGKARERVARERLGHVAALHEMDAEQTGFADASFDIAVAMFTASVVPDAKRLFAEMSRVVRPGGHLLFVNHFAAERGPRWWVERAMAPAARVLGWHPDFAVADLLDRAVTPISREEACPPLGLFTLLVVKRA
jgi:phosphatidylethanolamine/phosphatidyl-N-methylethanolamine N-methyltransferase